MPLRSTQLPTHRKAARRPWRRSPGGGPAVAATSRPGGTTTSRARGMPSCGQLCGQRVAGDQQAARAPVGQAVEPRLDAVRSGPWSMPPGGWCSMPPAAAARPAGQPGAEKRRGDAVEHERPARPGARPARSTRGASSAASGNGRSGNETKSSRASCAGPARPAGDGRGSRRSAGPGSPSVSRAASACVSSTSLRRRSARAACSAAASATRSSWPAPWPPGRLRADHLRPAGGPPARAGRACACARCRRRLYLGGHPAHPLAPGLFARWRGADRGPHPSYAQRAQPPGRAERAPARATRLSSPTTGCRAATGRGLLPRLFDRFLTVSAYSARELRAPPARTRVIYGGADPARYAPDPAVRRDGRAVRRPPHAAQRRRPPARRPAARRAPCVSPARRATTPTRRSATIPHCCAPGRRARRAVPGAGRRRRPAGALSPGGGAGAALGGTHLLRPPDPRVRAARPGRAGSDGERHAGDRQPPRRPARDRASTA